MEKKEHPYFKKFYVTKCGQIFSDTKGKMRKLKQRTNDFGYLMVSVLDPFDNKFKGRRVHRLVCETYLPNPENKKEVNHIDCNKKNNNLINLEWSTSQENKDHAWANYMYPIYGEQSVYASITETQVHSICQALQDGARNIDVVKSFGVSKAIVSQLRNGTNWKYITSKYDMKPKRVQRKSPESIIKIAQYLEAGRKDKEIEILLNVSSREVNRIRNRITHSVLTKDYKF